MESTKKKTSSFSYLQASIGYTDRFKLMIAGVSGGYSAECNLFDFDRYLM